MEKILKKYTTIPDHLYVVRSADLQLKRIIEEMQRPGYVLVARQMGKTNLLFHAKRSLENKDRLFAYVDMSNLHDSETDCYRNIINNILEPNEEFFSPILGEIQDIRQKKLPPHTEYSKSLRIILSFYLGDLVIVLDEIDALKSLDYSDNIFAQIRSNYFSRTNFPVFERLTYVLSGVIEPTELIRDRNKSPFNIGDKIYLDDFSVTEHEDFISKSKLDISKELSQEIFYWTNGNPRLTFDVCSEIESFILNNRQIDREVIHSIIRYKYLTNFDVAPIDHIRELVKTNKQIRQAVSLIHSRNTTELSDEIKKKLYLYGIINSSFVGDIKIKNRIIELSLSIDWIKSIEKLSNNSYNYGLERIEVGDFQEAILSLKEFLENSSPSKQQIEVCNYNLGFAYYNLRDYENAIEYFSKDFSISLYKDNSFSLLGSCKIAYGKIEEGLSILEDVVKRKTDDFCYRNALLNLARNLSSDQIDRSLSLYEALYESTFNSKDVVIETELNELRALALYYQSDIFLKKKNKAEALHKLDLALRYSPKSESLFLTFLKYYLEDEANDSYKEYIVTTILENQITFKKTQHNPLSFDKDLLPYYLEFVFDKDNTKLFEQLLDYSVNKLLPNTDKADLVYQASQTLKENKQSLLNYILQFHTPTKSELLLDIYRDLSFDVIENSPEYLKHFNEYVNIFKTSTNIKSPDIYLFARTIKFYSDSGSIKDALELCNIIDEKMKNLDSEELKFEYLIIYYWFANLNFTLKLKDVAKEYADKALILIKSSDRKKTSMIDEKGLESIAMQMLQIKESSTSYVPIKSPKKPGRNEKVKVRYLDNRIVEKKYKYLEADIIAERCQLIT